MSDLQVRSSLRQPSVECLIAKQRLAYAGRVTRQQPQALLGLLHIRKGATVIPWMSALQEDVQFLRTHVVPESPELHADPQWWHDIMNDETLWKKVVSELFFVSSATDRRRSSHTDERLSHECQKCDKAFVSARALKSHMRAAHGCKAQIRWYLRSPICPCCKVDFQTRMRCLAHLSDSRRPHCREWVTSHSSKMSSAEVAELDTELRIQRRQARQAGKSHPVADKPARRSDGRVIGRTC